MFKGSLGNSLWTNTPVMEEILYRLPITFELGIMALLVSLIVGIPIGVYAALKQDTVGDYVLRTFSILALAIPGFWVGTLVMVFPSIWWGLVALGKIHHLCAGSARVTWLQTG